MADRTPPKDPLDHEPAAVTYARNQAGLTKAELADACRVSASLITEIEAGTRNATPAMIGKLANALNCPKVVLERKRDNRLKLMTSVSSDNPIVHPHDPPFRPGSTNRRAHTVMTRIGTEALTRFAAEFLYRVKWAPPTAQGLEKAYLETVLPHADLDDVYADIQDLAEHVYVTHSEDFRAWAIRQTSNIREILED